MNRERYNKIAATAYDRYADRQARFDMAGVIADVAAELSSESVNGELIQEFASQLVHSVDKKKTARAEDGQIDLLTGEPAALDAVWRLGSGQRVRARYANRIDMVTWLGMRRENAERVVAAFKRDETAVAQLLPFMADDSVLVERAIEERKRTPGGTGSP